MMKKLILLFLSVALSLIIVDEAFSNTPIPQPEPTVVTQTEGETPLCYLQTPDGKTWNLNSLCEKAPEGADSIRQNVATVNPYNNAAIKKFDDDLYGEGN
ncbi:MAG: hypothetical protein KME01_08160 [Chroococcus sp. CMT-3BRIN-NPC107]|jgi:hypothetical protein|nr:hypothetical protein [Chroococcus sp. CMT-3BRIN-NPC107]